jgi:hypothetical protein
MSAKDKKENLEDAGKATAVVVLLEDGGGQKTPLRTYSFDEHGENFLDLAKMFKGKLEGQSKKVSLSEVK